MSGIAILVENADFSSRNLGTVTPVIPASMIMQYIPDTIVGAFKCTSPLRAVWSITSGNEYATVTEVGILDVKMSGTIVLSATIRDETATKTITVLRSTTGIKLKSLLSYSAGPLVTDIVVDDIANSEIEFSFRKDGGSGQNALFQLGSRSGTDSTDRFCASLDATRFNAMLGENQTGNQDFTFGSTPHVCILNSDGFDLDSNHYEFSSTGSIIASNYNKIVIGQLRNTSGTGWSAIKGNSSIGYIKIRDNGVLTHALIPYSDGEEFGWNDVILGKKYKASDMTSLFDSYVDL